MVFEVETAQELLLEEFNRRVRLNSRYSLRAYATFLGVSSGALSEIMKGQRPLSLKYAIKIAKALGLNTVESRKFISLVQNAKIENNSE
ncbi:MAG: helix-turn-helix domain-containing protein [Pseudobdellovibrio sp.]